MKKPKLYLDTTVWNFSFSDQAPDHRDETLEFFDKVSLGAFEIYASDVVLKELSDAPEPRKQQTLALVKKVAPIRLETTIEIERLADIYLAKGVLTEKSRADALHIAHATVYEMNYLLSWNFRHLANATRREKVTVVNFEEGYRYPLMIATPLEVLNAE